MLKNLILLGIVLFSIGLMNIFSVSAGEATPESGKTDMKDAYIDFLNGMLVLKSISAQYFPHLYPDTLYVGPGYTTFNHQDNINHTEKDLEVILIDLKWQLDKDWFLGVYSKTGRKDLNDGNNFHIQIKNPMDPDIGIIFIHEF
ncbi:MAG: hypothetical protein JRJ27_18295 [Deltaproteobacteria bacterium]|nr:hypothetical protein [Deltaproteobacteria bacterium]